MNDGQNELEEPLKKKRVDSKRIARRFRKIETATQRHAHRFLVRRVDNIRLAAREITVWLVTIGLVIGGIGLQLLWSHDDYIAKAEQPGGVYVEGAQGEVNSINPLFVSTNAEASVARLLFSTLYTYDTTGTLSSDLATAMSIDASGKVYTVTLRDNAEWSDGQKVTADDVVFTINLIKNAAVNSPLRVNWLDVAVASVNSTTVQFTLPAIYAAFPHALTFPILPKHLLESVDPSAIRESTYSSAPVGSGPFVFRRLQESDAVSKQRVVHMQANQRYYKGAPKLSRLELHAYPNESDIVKAVNSGELSGASDILSTSLSSITSKNVTVTHLLMDSGVYLLFNTKNELLTDVSVRQALQLATDTTAIQKTIGGGVRSLNGPLLEGQVTGTDVPVVPATNVDEAAKLLDAAGWKLSGSSRVKDGKKLEFTITTTQKKEYQTVLDSLKKQWQAIGVSLKTNSIDTTSAAATSFDQNVLQGRNFDILLYELSIGADPDVYAYWHSSSTYNFSGYANTLADSSLVSARSRLESELRNAKYKQFVRQWLHDAPGIGLYQPAIQYVARKNVNSVQQTMRLVTNADRYANVQYWTMADGPVYKTP